MCVAPTQAPDVPCLHRRQANLPPGKFPHWRAARGMSCSGGWQVPRGTVRRPPLICSTFWSRWTPSPLYKWSERMWEASKIFQNTTNKSGRWSLAMEREAFLSDAFTSPILFWKVANLGERGQLSHRIPCSLTQRQLPGESLCLLLPFTCADDSNAATSHRV